MLADNIGMNIAGNGFVGADFGIGIGMEYVDLYGCAELVGFTSTKVVDESVMAMNGDV